jgi:hypothetical protein
VEELDAANLLWVVVGLLVLHAPYNMVPGRG